MLITKAPIYQSPDLRDRCAYSREIQRDADHSYYLKEFVKWLENYHIEPIDKSWMGGITIPDCDAGLQTLLKEAGETKGSGGVYWET